MRRLLVWLMVVLAGCGQSQAASQAPPTARPAATPSASASSSAQASLGLLVVLEARGAGSTFGGGPDAYDAHDVVAIAGPDGFAKAKQRFQPRSLPSIGNAGVLMQPEARLASGAVFFIDGAGVVRRLDVNGMVTTITTFPFGQSQQEISFAVSPNGQHLVASVFTLPPRNPNAQNPADPPYIAGANAQLELLAADAGGPAKSLGVTNLGSSANSWAPLRVVGWDKGGPLVTLQSNLGTQQGSLGNWVEGIQLAYLDAGGHAGKSITPDDCLPWQLFDDGHILCSAGDYKDVRVLDRAGSTVMRFPRISGPFLTMSPDEHWLAYVGGVVNRSGQQVALPSHFFPEGWLNNSTVIGYQDASGVGASVGNMALVHLTGPSHLDDLGFTGVLAGVL